MKRFQLRCDPTRGCGGSLGEDVDRPMQLVAIVLKRGAIQRELLVHAEQVARRCRACGAINIFVPLRTDALDRIVA